MLKLVPKIKKENINTNDIIREDTKLETNRGFTVFIFGREVDGLSFYLYIISILFLNLLFYKIGFFSEMKKDFKLVIIYSLIIGIFILNIFTAPAYSFNYQLEYTKLTDIQQQLLVFTGNLIIYIFISIYLLKSNPYTNKILFIILIICIASIFSLSVQTEGTPTRTLRKVKQNNLNICICLVIICFYFQLKNYL